MPFVVGARGDSPYYISAGTAREVAYTCKDRFVYINKIRAVYPASGTPSTVTVEFYNNIDSIYVCLAFEAVVPASDGWEVLFEPLKLYRNDNISVTCGAAGCHFLIQTMVDGQPKAD